MSDLTSYTKTAKLFLCDLSSLNLRLFQKGNFHIVWQLRMKLSSSKYLAIIFGLTFSSMVNGEFCVKKSPAFKKIDWFIKVFSHTIYKKKRNKSIFTQMSLYFGINSSYNYCVIANPFIPFFTTFFKRWTQRILENYLTDFIGTYILIDRNLWMKEF